VVLPNIRFRVFPRKGIFRKWVWKVEYSYGSGLWYQAFDKSSWAYKGKSLTEKNALESGRKWAAKYCEELIEKREFDKFKLQNTTIEKVTCDGI
jgi:hypothetical protein